MGTDRGREWDRTLHVCCDFAKFSLSVIFETVIVYLKSTWSTCLVVEASIGS